MGDPTLRPMPILKLKPIMVMVTLMVTTDTIMANVALKLRLIPAPTTMVIMVMVWDLSMVMVTTHTLLTMLTTMASAVLKLKLIHGVTIPGIMDTDAHTEVTMADTTGAKLTDQKFLPLTDKFSQIF